jgi:hypothetical protein
MCGMMNLFYFQYVKQTQNALRFLGLIIKWVLILLHEYETETDYVNEMCLSLVEHLPLSSFP